MTHMIDDYEVYRARSRDLKEVKASVSAFKVDNQWKEGDVPQFNIV